MSNENATREAHCSVSLERAGWQAVIENLRRGALEYEISTGEKAKGIIALIRDILDQLNPNAESEAEDE